MKITDALAKSSAALDALTQQIARSHNLLNEYPEAATAAPSQLLDTAAKIITFKDAAERTLKVYGDIDLVKMDGDDVETLVLNRATGVAQLRTKSNNNDYYTHVEELEYQQMDNASKFVHAINRVALGDNS